MRTFQEILMIENESEKKEELQRYEYEKRSCEGDSAGVRCAACNRRKTKFCFNPKKEKEEGWKWT